MQKLLPVDDGLKAYLASPDMLVTEKARECPFCTDRHRLRLHGHYHRVVLVPGRGSVKAPIRRLLCVHTGRTVSLLPGFCIPRRQHGPEVVGTFLDEYAKGLPLLPALRVARPDARGHSVAQSLRKGFLIRAGSIRTYLARLRARALEPALTVTGLRREVAALLVGLCHGYATAADAFLRHGIELHAALHTTLA